MNNKVVDLPLRDIHLPDSISWWPLAPGWLLILAAILACSIIAVIFIRKFRKPTLKKSAIKALDLIENTFQQNQDPKLCISELSRFLRRVVISKNSLKHAGVTGQAWLQLLDKPLKEPEFSQGIGKILLTGPYQPNVERESVLQLINLCRKWVNFYD